MIFMIYNFFKKQCFDDIGRCGVMLQLTLLVKFITIIFIFSFYYTYLPWYIYISFSFDLATMIFGFVSSYTRKSVLLFIFFLFSLVLFLFDFIPLILMNSDIWNEISGNVSPKDIFQSICEIIWFSTEVLTMHFARKERSLIENLNDQIRDTNEINSSININNNNNIENKDHSQSTIKDKKPSLIICVDGYQNEPITSNCSNSINNDIKQIDNNHCIVNINNENNNNSNNNNNNNNNNINEESNCCKDNNELQNQQYSLNQRPLDDNHFISIDLSETVTVDNQNIKKK